ncbi:enoyl-CoA hydratase/isomerase family protein [Metabacillus iocasae]|uniref:Enoyl-CoA hydratase/carnithine racemase n=1 Tax=Priestia iocasae TaxID=2291674 RepID=A0ABS2QS22_9BACI|nr:enoyl-CoA hydratase/isomerase family protein [Metabacillus iocasae]MBM7701757.1 enoyl-CoA hydratase/carnithine racemase [Metabacillus iocasae]
MKKTLFDVSESGIATFTIDRPNRRNAIDYDVMDRLKEAIQVCKDNSLIKALIITGSGDKAFCSGGDLDVFHSIKTEQEAAIMLMKMGRILYELLTLEKPTVAVMNGVAVGGGCEIAAACDIRIGSEHSRMGFIQGNLGITTGWGGGSILFEKLPYNQALSMLQTAKLYSAQEAKELGFLQYIALHEERMEKAYEVLEEAVQKPLQVLSSYKQIVKRKWEQSNLWDRINVEILTCAKLWDSEPHHQAVEKFMTKSK